MYISAMFFLHSARMTTRFEELLETLEIADRHITDNLNDQEDSGVQITAHCGRRRRRWAAYELASESWVRRRGLEIYASTKTWRGSGHETERKDLWEAWAASPVDALRNCRERVVGGLFEDQGCGERQVVWHLIFDGMGAFREDGVYWPSQSACFDWETRSFLLCMALTFSVQ